MGIHYSVEADPDTTAKAMLRERPISLKHSKEISRELKGQTIAEAEEYLEAVIDGERSVPFRQHNSGVGHRSDIDGWDAGRFPQKASEEFLGLLENVRNNASEQGFDPDEMVIHHVAAHKVGERAGRKPRAFGRASPWNTTLCDVELVVEEPEEVREAEEPDEDAETEPDEAESVEDEAELDADETVEAAQAADDDDGPETLEAISGVSDEKADALREAGYETVTDLRAASEGELSDVEGIGNALAARIKADVGGLAVTDEDESDAEPADEAGDDETDEPDAEGDDEDTGDAESDADEAEETEEDN